MISDLKCAADPLLVFAFVSARQLTLLCLLCLHRLRCNATPEGIIALCEGLNGSSVTLLECAATPTCLPLCVSAS